MEFDVIGRQEKPLLEREDIEIEIAHAGDPTPSTEDVRSTVAAELDLDPKAVEVYEIRSSAGRSTSRALVRAHEDPIVDELPGEEESESEGDEAGDDIGEGDPETEEDDVEEEPDEAEEEAEEADVDGGDVDGET